MRLDPQPRWVFHGYWKEDGSELVLVDVIPGSLLRYDREGRKTGSVTRPGSGLLDFDRPLKIVGRGEALILFSPNHLVGLNESLEPSWGVRLPLDLAGSEKLLGMMDLVASGQQLVAMLTILGDNGQFWWGLGRLTLGQSPKVERLEVLPALSTPAGDLYSISGPILARAGGAVYALRFEDAPHIQKLLPERRRLEAFPVGYGRAPQLPPPRGPAGTEARFRALEAATMPVSLFGRGSFLYLLTRAPGDKGGTTWTLHQIDPAKDVLTRSVRLPTVASHIVVVPGSANWAVIEKGRVVGSGEQAIDSLMLVPSKWIEDPRARPVELQCMTASR